MKRNTATCLLSPRDTRTQLIPRAVHNCQRAELQSTKGGEQSGYISVLDIRTGATRVAQWSTPAP